MSQCIYCSNTVTEPHPVTVGAGQEQVIACSESCAAETAEFFASVERHKRHFIAGVCVSMAVLIAAVILMNVQYKVLGGILMGASMVLLGLVVFLMPFATPQTFEMLQIKKTKLVTKIIGVFVGVLGVLFGALIAAGI